MPDYLTREQSAFIVYLMKLNTDANRGTLAVMRRGLAGIPLEDLNLYRYVTSHISDNDRGTNREGVYYLVAALYGLHPMQVDSGNMGSHMKQAAILRKDMEAAERRFTFLINASLDDLVPPLRQAVMMLKQLDIPVNWVALFAGLIHWNHPDKFVQRTWANSFWAYERPIEIKAADQPSEN